MNNSIITVKFKLTTMESQKASFNQSQGMQVVRVNMLGFYDLQLPPQSDPLTVVQNYLNSRLVDIAEPNTFGEYVGNPNDPRFPEQWFHQAISIPYAWDWETGDPGAIIGILDSGTDILHENLKGNIWVNPGKDLDGDGVVWDPDDMNGIDDDGSGLVDDLVGWDFHNNNNNVVGPYYHGIHVAGIAAAVTDNGKGVAGVAGGVVSFSWWKMLICGVGDYYPNGSILDDAILYAMVMGIDVITLSLTEGRVAPLMRRLKQPIITAFLLIVHREIIIVHP